MNRIQSGAIRPQVLVIGEALIDIVETPTCTVETPGGSPANVVLGLGRLGVGVSLLTCIADDKRGRRIRSHLTESGVYVLPESVTGSTTSTAVARVSENGQAEYEFHIRWDPAVMYSAGDPVLLHTGSIAAFLAPGASRVHEAMRSMVGNEVTFDPNIRPTLVGNSAQVRSDFEKAASLASVVKLSDEDAAWLYPDQLPREVLAKILKLGPRLVAMTRGADGALLATRAEYVSIPAVPVTIVDAIGAGDSFMASLIASILTYGSYGLDAARLLWIGRMAVRAAAITVSRAGADLPYLHEVLKASER